MYRFVLEIHANSFEEAKQGFYQAIKRAEEMRGADTEFAIKSPDKKSKAYLSLDKIDEDELFTVHKGLDCMKDESLEKRKRTQNRFCGVTSFNN